VTPRDLAVLLGSFSYPLGHETLLQEAVEKVLTDEKVPFKREFVLSPGSRVDFFVDEHIALELKIKMSARHVFRQLERYATHDQVDSLVLMTLGTGGVPPSVNDKPIYVVNLARTAL